MFSAQHEVWELIVELVVLGMLVVLVGVVLLFVAGVIEDGLHDRRPRTH